MKFAVNRHKQEILKWKIPVRRAHQDLHLYDNRPVMLSAQSQTQNQYKSVVPVTN
jgi:hypothetical protein